MTNPLLLDLSHTSHSPARTGIQRVARSLVQALGNAAVSVTHDPYAGTWRPLEPWENANLDRRSAGMKRGAQWPLHARLRGRARRLFARGGPALPHNCGLLVPEVFSPAVGRALPELFAASRGPCAALFHDAIALKFPELTPAKTVARFPAYLIELLGFDGIAAVSEDSRQSLLDYWHWLGVARHPPVVAIPLGVDVPHHPTGNAGPDDGPPVILAVGSIEGRKNHLALLDAGEQLWAGGAKFSLRLIGLANVQTGRAALTRIRELQAAGRPLNYDGPVDDAGVAAAYAACAFTVYPSVMEGFGLPVIESLVTGKPCICSARGATGESARGGGCMALDTVDAPSLAAAIGRLLTTRGELAALTAAARERRFKTWGDYTKEVTAWMGGLSVKDAGQPLHLQ